VGRKVTPHKGWGVEGLHLGLSSEVGIDGRIPGANLRLMVTVDEIEEVGGYSTIMRAWDGIFAMIPCCIGDVKKKVESDNMKDGLTKRFCFRF